MLVSGITSIITRRYVAVEEENASKLKSMLFAEGVCMIIAGIAGVAVMSVYLLFPGLDGTTQSGQPPAIPILLPLLFIIWVLLTVVAATALPYLAGRTELLRLIQVVPWGARD